MPIKKTYAFGFIFVAAALICLSAHRPASYIGPPPGTVKIGDNLYYDHTEVPNVTWKEYMFWTGKIFGKNSDEYRATMPDTMVWAKTDPCLTHFTYDYFRFSYRDAASAQVYIPLPVVGITQKQAEDFSKWRSDRVFEGVLIENKVIKENTAQNRDTYFTIEKYFGGKYETLTPDTNFKYYPDYRLPTAQEWRKAVLFADSTERRYRVKPLAQNTDANPCSRKNHPAITIPVSDDQLSQKKHPLLHLKGNVSEWTAEKDISIGGGWADKARILMVQDTFHLNSANAWTGFRNICAWKEYKLK